MKSDLRKEYIALPRLEKEKARRELGTDCRSQSKNQHQKTNIMNTVTKTQTKDPQTAGQVSHTNRPFITPEVNIFENKDSYVLEAEIPGVSKAGLEITLEGNELTIVGRREGSELRAALLYRESAVADYRRVFELDPAIDTAKINANVDQGVLTLHLPKSEQVKPRKVTVSD
jgi:HSP20 family protein